MRVYEGTSAASPLVAQLSGTSLPADVMVSGEAMFVTFTTDSGVVGPGFVADYSAAF